MSLLSPEQSWDLLRETVFGQKDCPYALERIGRKIAENCKGLPLAIVVIGGLLSTRDNQKKDWQHCTRLVHDLYLCSILYFCDHHSTNHLMSSTVSFRLLKVLDALAIRFNEFPVGILELVHLRYLAFYICKCKLPESICKLQNLQTLVVYLEVINRTDLNDTLYLPLNIWKMPKLRHLLFNRGFLPDPFLVIAKDSIVLENLQTLSEATNFRCTKEVLEIMPNLKKLGISYSGIECSSYEFNNFVYLHKLETLKCFFIYKAQAQKPLPLNLAFPPNLRKLTLSGCKLPWEKMTIIGSLPNLEVLKLKDFAFDGSTWEPNEGEFTRLKYLLIDTNLLEHWSADHTHFPRLQHLSLKFCFWLKAIPIEIADIETLETIELCECRSSVVASAMLIQEQQQSLGNEGLRVRVNSFDDYCNSHFNTSLRKVRSSRRERLTLHVFKAAERFRYSVLKR
ncbi:UNVERIFIED_CONTAM: hypothetical protein Slati_3218700 [Sesamum latifolium]|uniref:Disease resistance R13L4/SHOC-2-like LRR domain-containing protein n=1 Tax=Sesamum latifolium TaxID=2727402 RepID=A0AAW2UYF4_9LAMI